MSPTEEQRKELERRHPFAAMGWALYGLGAYLGAVAGAAILLFALVYMLLAG